MKTKKSVPKKKAAKSRAAVVAKCAEVTPKAITAEQFTAALDTCVRFTRESKNGIQRRIVLVAGRPVTAVVVAVGKTEAALLALAADDIENALIDKLLGV